MTTSAESRKTSETSLTRDVINLGRHYLGNGTRWARPYLGGRRGLILLAVVVLGAGAALNWGWLVAIGLAPILLALAPCAIMCAVGLCAMKGGGKSCSTQSSSTGGDVKAQSSSTATGAEQASAPVSAASAGTAAALRERADDGDDGGDAKARPTSTARSPGSADEPAAVAARKRAAAVVDRRVDDAERWLDELTQTEPVKERK